MDRPGVGVATVVIRDGHVIMQRRLCEHGHGLWSFPGGHLELMEDWDECALREFHEEVSPDVKISQPIFWKVVNAKSPLENKHYVTIFMLSFWLHGDLPTTSSEPDKHTAPIWAPINNLPTPLMPGIEWLVSQRAELPKDCYNLYTIRLRSESY